VWDTFETVVRRIVSGAATRGAAAAVAETALACKCNNATRFLLPDTCLMHNLTTFLCVLSKLLFCTRVA